MLVKTKKILKKLLTSLVILMQLKKIFQLSQIIN